MIFEVRMWNERWKDALRCLYTYIFKREKEFGDIEKECFVHHFTKKQVRDLFKGYSFSFEKNVIRVNKND